VTLDAINKRGGKLMLKYYGGSITRALKRLYPEYAKPLQPRRPTFLEECAKEIGVDPNHFKQHPLNTPTETKVNLPGKVQTHTDVSLEPKEQELTRKPKGFWTDIKNQREFFEQIATELNVDISDPSQWNQITSHDIVQRGGKGLLNHYSSSVTVALQTAFPDHTIGTTKQKGYWTILANQRKFFEGVAKDLNIDVHNPSHWKLVHSDFIAKNGGSSILKKYNGSFVSALKKIFPDTNWEELEVDKDVHRVKWGKTQWHLFTSVKEVILTESVKHVADKDFHVDYKHPDLAYSDSKLKMQLDVFIPPLNLAFEYQGMN
jgi:hypothetical protein